MYNVGFGDAFLMWLPDARGRMRTVLVDCGVHSSGVVNPMSKVAPDIIASVSESGAPRIDVVVATHRHFDHIAGFDSKVWDAVEVGEVWLPWTERRGDPIADDLRRKQHRLALALQGRFGRGTAGSLMALNALSNAGAERCLLSGFAGTPVRRFLPEPDGRELTSRHLPGIAVHALGPSRSLETIARLDPPIEDSFLVGKRSAGEPPVPAGGQPASPTSNSGPLSPNPLFAQRYVWSDSNDAKRALDVDDKLLRKLEDRAAPDDFAAASALDDAINGTSLVLAFGVCGHVLLFGGDAEYGTWSELLSDRSARRLLGRTTLYKVSHHGSYNGTPRSFVEELLPKDALSLVSLTKVKKWPSIPRTSLLDALAEGDRRLIRTDQLDAVPAEVSVTHHPTGLWVEIELAPRGDDGRG
jgi:beta-lactamase superfamily II metal-dependent hydrolase